MPASRPLALRLLGGFAGTAPGGRPLALGSRKHRALIAYLACRAGTASTRESLAGLLWGEIPDEQARSNLRQGLFALRRALADADAPPIQVDGETVALDAAAVAVDVIDFQRLVKEGSPASLERAVDLYGGELLPDLLVDEHGFDEWLVSERERLRLLAVEALSRLLAHQTASDETERAIDTAQALLRLEPLEEVVHRALMRLYLKQGRRAAALRQFQVCVTALDCELGVEPEPQTVRLADLARHGDRADEPGPPSAVPDAAREGEPVAGTQSPVVLVVDDDDDTRRLLEAMLRSADYRVVVAVDGADAIVQLARRRVDVVLTDIVMPTLDGLKLLEVMHEKGIAAPAIVLTGREDDGAEIRGFELGAVDYIRKPIRKEVLLLRLENALRRVAGTTQVS